jgi:rod shape-determining protein MreB
MAAAIGAGLPVADAGGNLVVDIGGGTTEVAVISLGGMVVWESLRVGGYEMDDAIVRYAKSARDLLVGQESAEEVKIAIATATDLGDERIAELSGRDVVSGFLRRIEVTSAEIRHAIAGPIGRIVDAIKATLEQTPPELAADIMQRGIVLAGGGALVSGMDRRLSEETHLPVTIVDSPLTCVAEGAGRSLAEYSAILRASNSAR